MNLLEKYISAWKKKALKPNEIDIENLIINLKNEDYLSVSPAVYYILDLQKNEYKFISENIVDLLGLSEIELTKSSASKFYDLIHPEDSKIHAIFSVHRLENFLKTIQIAELFNFKFSFNYRVKRKGGNYFQIQQEFIILEVNEFNIPTLNLGFVTDISENKTNNKISFRVSKFDNNKGFIEISEEFYPGHILTAKEIEIIKLAKEGFNSNEIANKLYNALNTIKTHRKNILRKLSVNKFQKAINYCKEYGII